MSHNPTTPDLAPISPRDFSTTLRVLRTLEEFQRVQHANMPNMSLGYTTPFRSPLTPAIAAVAHFSDWLPRITPAAPQANRANHMRRPSKNGARRG